MYLEAVTVIKYVNSSGIAVKMFQIYLDVLHWKVAENNSVKVINTCSELATSL